MKPLWCGVCRPTPAGSQTGGARRCSGWRWCRTWTGCEPTRLQSWSGRTPWCRRSAWNWAASRTSRPAPPGGERIPSLSSGFLPLTGNSILTIYINSRVATTLIFYIWYQSEEKYLILNYNFTILSKSIQLSIIW